LNARAALNTHTAVDATIPAASEPPPTTQASRADEIRVATREDEPALLELLQTMHAEGGLLPLDLDRARAMFARAFDRRGGIIGVIGPKNDIEAMIGLLITSFWYTRSNHLEQFVLCVRPDKRKNKHAETLRSSANKCSEAIGIPMVVGLVSDKQTQTKSRARRRASQAAPSAPAQQ
jgi:N-acetylglutamate synthase-like GNAT family acetyltransferase